MYLRETKRRNADGSELSYLALAHNERDPKTGQAFVKLPVPPPQVVERALTAIQTLLQQLQRPG